MSVSCAYADAYGCAAGMFRNLALKLLSDQTGYVSQFVTLLSVRSHATSPKAHEKDESASRA